jgi:flagellar biogenesis protein FliO
MDTMLWPMVKMIVALGGMCAGLLFAVRQLKRNGTVRKAVLANSGVRVLTTQLIAPQKYISLVEIGGEVLALGVSESQITLLTKVENKEFTEKLTTHGSEKREPFSFLHCLQGLPLRPRGQRPGVLREIYGK